MMIPFDQLSPQSRIWIFMASDFLTPEQESELLNQTGQFLGNWTAHNHALSASACILHHLFLIIAVDESKTGASGCSIDTLFRFIGEMEKKTGLGLLNRNRIACPEGDTIRLFDFHEFRQKVISGRVDPQTRFFNNTIQTKAELDKGWLCKAGILIP